MSIGPYICVACGAIGCISGAAAGSQNSLMLGIIGGTAGLLLGITSFVAIAIPYVLWIIRYHPKTPNPPALWRMLYLPLMVLSLILSAVVPFLIFRPN
jgi:uncharacterized membrane protein